MYNILNEGETNRLLSGAESRGRRDFTMIFLALATGLRCSELVGLKNEDIIPFGMPASILIVPPRLAKRGKKREIPLNTETRDVISKFFETKEYRREPTTPDAYFFLSFYTHTPLSSRDFQRIVKQTSLAFINRSITPHTLRHTFATRLLKLTNIRVVQELLGHSRLQTTQIYTHVNSNDTRSAIDNLKLSPIVK